MTVKTIDTLIKDMNHVLETGEGWTEEISQWVASDIAHSLTRQFSAKSGKPKRTLRASNIGTPCARKLWFFINSKIEHEPLATNIQNKFIFGDITESYLLGLAKAAGHRVEGLQGRVDVHGIKGSRDCIIDGVLIDVKSAASRSYEKFTRNALRSDDPFGYLSQLSTYLKGSHNDPLLENKTEAGFLAFDKQFGHFCLDMYDLTDFLEKKEEEIESRKQMVLQETPPPRSYEPVPQSKTSPNKKLGTACSYCDHKNECWPNLRKFVYSSGPVWLTEVVNEPKVFEEK